MTVLSQLSVPVIASPMAGGPSTPALVDALFNSGGLGFLAGGYLSAAALRAQMDAVTAPRYGVNLFYPQAAPASLLLVDDYAEQLKPLFTQHGVAVPDYADADPTDAFAEKFALLLELRPTVASCTFGLFSEEEVSELHEAGIEVWMTVTCPRDAAEAERRGADVLIVQGPEAGGHRSTLTVEEEPDGRSAYSICTSIETALPKVLAGGIATWRQLQWAFHAGATAVACGTAFLLAEEAGTSEAHKVWIRAAVDKQLPTATTRAFSGRVARGVETDFMRAHQDAPAVYPHVNTLMKPLRGLADTPEFVAPWAGVRVSQAKELPAADIVSMLTQPNWG
ncbi:nitronate monooxygenase [Staphylococcus chromogenes]|nr:nitronate monooxygenase [Staphylococcus chromogenes]